MIGRKKMFKDLWEYAKASARLTWQMITLKEKSDLGRLQKIRTDRYSLPWKMRKKCEVFQNLSKLWDAGTPFNKVIITHDLTKKQKWELKDKIQEAQGKESKDGLGEFMFRVRGPPWSWYIKKIPKDKPNSKPKNCRVIITMPTYQCYTLTNKMPVSNILPTRQESSSSLQTRRHALKNFPTTSRENTMTKLPRHKNYKQLE